MGTTDNETSASAIWTIDKRQQRNQIHWRRLPINAIYWRNCGWSGAGGKEEGDFERRKKLRSVQRFFVLT